MRRRLALTQLSLPRDEFPNLIESAEDTAEVWLTDPNEWWGNTVDLITLSRRMLSAAAKVLRTSARAVGVVSAAARGRG